VGLACAPVQVVRDLERAPETVNLRDEAYVRRAAARLPDIGRKVGRSPPLRRKAVLQARCCSAAAQGVVRQRSPAWTRGRRARAAPAAAGSLADGAQNPVAVRAGGVHCQTQATWGPAAGPMAWPTARLWNPAAPRAGGVPAEHRQPGHRQRLQHRPQPGVRLHHRGREAQFLPARRIPYYTLFRAAAPRRECHSVRLCVSTKSTPPCVQPPGCVPT